MGLSCYRAETCLGSRSTWSPLASTPLVSGAISCFNPELMMQTKPNPPGSPSLSSVFLHFGPSQLIFSVTLNEISSL